MTDYVHHPMLALEGDDTPYELLTTDGVTALVAEGEIMFVHLDQKDPTFGSIDQKNFVFSMNLLGILEVGKAGDGSEENQPEA